MSKETLEEWLARRIPAVPSPFLPHLVEVEEEAPATPQNLARLGMECLGRALETPGRIREAAFQLLAADAFLTYACEAMVDEGDVHAGLVDVLRRTGDRFR